MNNDNHADTKPVGCASTSHDAQPSEQDIWNSEDESRFAAALLYVGAEPSLDDATAHAKWQYAAAEFLLQKYANEVWYDCERLVWIDEIAPDQYLEMLEAYRQAKTRELRAFYAWVCKSRGESWDKTIANGTLAFM